MVRTVPWPRVAACLHDLSVYARALSFNILAQKHSSPIHKRKVANELGATRNVPGERTRRARSCFFKPPAHRLSLLTASHITSQERCILRTSCMSAALHSGRAVAAFQLQLLLLLWILLSSGADPSSMHEKMEPTQQTCAPDIIECRILSTSPY